MKRLMKDSMFPSLPDSSESYVEGIKIKLSKLQIIQIDFLGPF